MAVWHTLIDDPQLRDWVEKFAPRVNTALVHVQVFHHAPGELRADLGDEVNHGLLMKGTEKTRKVVVFASLENRPEGYVLVSISAEAPE
jgi:hypothetical protein